MEGDSWTFGSQGQGCRILKREIWETRGNLHDRSQREFSVRKLEPRDREKLGGNLRSPWPNQSVNDEDTSTKRRRGDETSRSDDSDGETRCGWSEVRQKGRCCRSAKETGLGGGLEIGDLKDEEAGDENHGCWDLGVMKGK